MAKTKIPKPPVTRLPTTSGIIDVGLFNQIHDLVLTTGKEDGDAYLLDTGKLLIYAGAELAKDDAALLIINTTSRIARVYGCQGLQEDMRERIEPCLYSNTFMFLSCRVPEEFQDEMLEEILCECSFLPDDKKREIVFKVRDEIGPEKIREMFCRALETAKRRVA